MQLDRPTVLSTYAATGVTCSFGRFLSSGQSRPGSDLRAASVGLDDYIAA